MAKIRNSHFWAFWTSKTSENNMKYLFLQVAKNLQMSERIRPDEPKVNEVDEVDIEVVSDVGLSGDRVER